MRAFFHKSNNTRISSDYITKKHAKTLIEVIKTNNDNVSSHIWWVYAPLPPSS